MSETVQAQLKRGVLELCILASLFRSDSYGYDLVARLPKDIEMAEGTIYPLMRRLQAEGLVETYLGQSDAGPPRKYYRITQAGIRDLSQKKAAWVTFSTAVSDALRDVP